MAYRLGRFFTIIGVVLLALFFASDATGTPLYRLFFIGAPLTAIGIYMMRRFAPKPTPSGRFSWLKNRKK
ncbi:MAG: hypothetical protein D6755_12760 [Anaerolineae bacterium]|nr:MAG: hypothetical protein D6755_12760 [Anaerolineae bacterium]